MKGKRVLLYSHELTHTGAPAALLSMANVLADAGFYVEMWAAEDGPFAEKIAERHVLRVVPYDELSGEPRLGEISSFDMAIANTVVAHRFYAAAVKLIPVVWFIHEAQNLPAFVSTSPLAQALLRSSKDLYCTSEYAQGFIEKAYGQRAKILRNAVEDRFGVQPNAQALKLPDAAREAKVKFITMGTIDKRKAVDVCFKAFEMLPRRLKEKAHYCFAGASPGGKFARKLLKKIERNPRMTYLGLISGAEEKLSLFRQMDALVLASRDDAAPLVVLEGAMMGKAIVLSENVGTKYLVDSSSGYIVKTGDARSLARALADIIENPDKLEAMGEAARKKYLETSTMETYGQNVLSMAREKIKEGAAAAKAPKGYVELADGLLNGYNESISLKAILPYLIKRRLEGHKAIFSIAKKARGAADGLKKQLRAKS